MWEVIVGDRAIKSFPHRLQCVVWCYEKGLVWTSGKFGDKLLEDVMIKERKES